MKALHIVGIVVGLGLLGFLYYAISPLFITIEANDALPIAEESTAQEESPSPSQTFETAPIPIVDTPTHPASGTVRIVSDGENNFVRYENFKTINGPDIFVYLAKDLEAKEFISLGRVIATEGNVNYAIPSDVDPREYPYVLVWCKAFGVLFNSAKVY